MPPATQQPQPRNVNFNNNPHIKNNPPKSLEFQMRDDQHFGEAQW